MEKISIEDDESLQEMWAGLIANASDPERRLQLKKVYIEILSLIEPLDAAVLRRLDSSERWTTGEIASQTRMEHEDITDEEVWASLQNLARLGCIYQEKHETWAELSKSGFDVTDARAFVTISDLGASLLAACAVGKTEEEGDQ